MSSYRELLAWQTPMDLVDAIYDVVALFPAIERFGLSAQMRGAAVSIPSHIAEGHGRFNFRDFRRFLRGARGSLHELETHVLSAPAAVPRGRCRGAIAYRLRRCRLSHQRLNPTFAAVS